MCKQFCCFLFIHKPTNIHFGSCCILYCILFFKPACFGHICDHLKGVLWSEYACARYPSSTSIHRTHTSSNPAFLLCTLNWCNGYVLTMTTVLPNLRLIQTIKLGVCSVKFLFILCFFVNCIAGCPQPNTRWFKYDRDKLWLVYTQIVPVIFEPPCTLQNNKIVFYHIWTKVIRDFIILL
jgi:hypothetical protein